MVCPDEERSVQLREWTRRELTLRNLGNYSELFLFTTLPADTTSPRQFFFGPVWHQPHTDAPVRLMKPLTTPPPESGVVFSTV